MSGNFLQGQVFGKVLRDIENRFLNQFVVFFRNIVKHIFREGFQYFLKLIAEIIQTLNVLKSLQELIIHLQDNIVGRASLNGRPGQKGAEFDGSGLNDFQIAAFGKNTYPSRSLRRDLAFAVSFAFTLAISSFSFS